MTKALKTAALALAFSGTIAAAPALAADVFAANAAHAVAGSDASWNHGRGHGHGGYGGYDRGYDGGVVYTDNRYYDDRGYYGGGNYAEPYYRGMPVWRGNDGRAYCRRRNGTTGLLIGGAAGALLGREVVGRYGDRTAGMIVGGAAGALLGRAVDRNGSRCR